MNNTQLNKESIDVIAEARKDKKFKQYVQDASIKIKLANEVYQARQMLGVTQFQLAKMVQTTQAIISRIENFEFNIGIELLNRLAEQLKFKESNWANIFNFKIGSMSQDIGFMIPKPWLNEVKTSSHSMSESKNFSIQVINN